ncbi:MAG: hypothetical protein RLZZ274_2170, partial [Cyanobacteriota bacterium]
MLRAPAKRRPQLGVSWRITAKLAPTTAAELRLAPSH